LQEPWGTTPPRAPRDGIVFGAAGSHVALRATPPEDAPVDPWPALPEAEPRSPDETTARVVSLLRERARLERLARDQVERSWNA
jgi:hypothetical protein